jgi:hypothetical protein
MNRLPSKDERPALRDSKFPVSGLTGPRPVRPATKLLIIDGLWFKVCIICVSIQALQDRVPCGLLQSCQ